MSNREKQKKVNSGKTEKNPPEKVNIGNEDCIKNAKVKTRMPQKKVEKL